MANVKVVVAGIGVTITSTPIEDIDRHMSRTAAQFLHLESVAVPGKQFRVNRDSVHAYFPSVEDTIDVPDALPDWMTKGQP